MTLDHQKQRSVILLPTNTFRRTFPSRTANIMQDSHSLFAASIFVRSCLALFALLLRHTLSQNQSFRNAAGTPIAAAILFIPPMIYSPLTQTSGLATAAMCSFAALCVLHWTFLESPEKKPSTWEMILSPMKHQLTGMIKVQQRHSRQQQAACKTPSTTPTTSDPTPLWKMLTEVLLSLLVVHLIVDVGIYLLCSTGFCSHTRNIHPWLAPTISPSADTSALPYLFRAAFALPAGVMLVAKIEGMYCTGRLILILLAFKWPMLQQLAAEMPAHAFKSPCAATSMSQLWSLRWHQALRFYFEGLGGAAVNALFPRATPALRSSMRCVAAFAMSGLIHEYLTWALFGSLSGWQMAFFMLNCAAVLFEGWAPVLLSACPKAVRVCRLLQQSHAEGHGEVDASCVVTAHVAPRPQNKAGRGNCTSVSTNSSACKQLEPSWADDFEVPMWLKRVWTVLLCFLLAPLFIEPYRAAGFYSYRLDLPFGAPVTPRVLAWLANAGAGLGLS
jgi:hypothetical protein